LVSADQLLARLCSIPTNDVAMASIVLLREVAHSGAPALQRPPIEILDHLRRWLARASLDPETQAAARFCRRSAQLVCTEPDRPVPPRTTNPLRLLLTRATATQANRAGRTRTSHHRLKTAKSAVRSRPCPPGTPRPEAQR